MSRVWTGLLAVTHPPRRAVVTVGVFDGMHRAHQALIRATVRLARRVRGTSVAITFDPDPETVLAPRHPHPALMPLQARLAHLSALGIERVWVIPFTTRFARLSAQQFLHRVLVQRLRARALVVGERFAFGRGRAGTMTLLKTLGPRYGMRMVALREIRQGGAAISSSRIRRAITEGRLAQARQWLGRPPELFGVVERGSGRGRRLGFPTANLRLTSEVLPPRGVYAVRVHDALRRRTWRALTPPPIRVRDSRTVAGGHFASGELIGGGVMNLGVRPTFGPGPLVCEVHLLGFSGSLLGRSVSVSLLARLRGERRFPSAAALARQVRRDLARSRQIFARLR